MQGHNDWEPRTIVGVNTDGNACTDGPLGQQYVRALQCRGLRARNTLAWAGFPVWFAEFELPSPRGIGNYRKRLRRLPWSSWLEMMWTFSSVCSTDLGSGPLLMIPISERLLGVRHLPGSITLRYARYIARAWASLAKSLHPNRPGRRSAGVGHLPWPMFGRQCQWLVMGEPDLADRRSPSSTSFSRLLPKPEKATSSAAHHTSSPRRMRLTPHLSSRRFRARSLRGCETLSVLWNGRRGTRARR